jgi:hypothetical protein
VIGAAASAGCRKKGKEAVAQKTEGPAATQTEEEKAQAAAHHTLQLASELCYTWVALARDFKQSTKETDGIDKYGVNKLTPIVWRSRLPYLMKNATPFAERWQFLISDLAGLYERTEYRNLMELVSVCVCVCLCVCVGQ